MPIYKRKGTPFWQYTFGSSGQRIQKSLKTKDKKLALKIANKLDAELLMGNFGIINPNRRISDCVEDFLDYRIKVLKPIDYRRWVLIDFAEKNKHRRIKDISRTDVEQYLYTHDRKQSTLKNYKALISMFFNYCIENRYTDKNPRAGINFVIPKIESLNHLDVKNAIEQEKDELHKAFWSVLLYTGLRSIDAGSLSSDNIYDDRIKITTKKTNTDIVIPLHPDLKKYDLIQLRNTKEKKRHSMLKLRKFITNATLHKVRHTFASRLLEIGASEFDVSYLMGHSIKSITGRYVDTSFEQHKKYIRNI